MDPLLRNMLRCSTLLIVLCRSSTTFAAESPDVVELLHAWQNSATEQPALLAEAAFDSRGIQNAHERAIAAELFGPVDARRLIREFAWTVRADQGRVMLHAVPRDEFTRLFCAGVDIEWDAENRRPRTLRFYDDPASPRTVAILSPDSPPSEGVPHRAARPVHGDTLIQLASLSVVDSPAAAAPPALPDILQRWAEATSRISRADLEFVFYRYDSLYLIEQRCRGRFRWEAPDRACYERFGTGEDAGVPARRNGPDGEPFTRDVPSPVMFSWNGSEVIIAHPDLRTYAVFDVPSDREARQTGSWGRIWSTFADPHTILPGVVDAHSDAFQSRFEWSLLRQDDKQILLRGVPLREEDQRDMAQLQVILDPDTFRVRATRMDDPTGNVETVHVFRESRYNEGVNDSPNWTSDLKGYEQIDSAPPAPPAATESTSQSTRSLDDTLFVGVLQAHALLTHLVAQ